jgi:hypothetical protein
MDCERLAMLYIKKIRAAKEVIDEINRVKREQKSLLDKRDHQSARTAFNCLDKTVIRDSLIREQHGLSREFPSRA